MSVTLMANSGSWINSAFVWLVHQLGKLLPGGWIQFFKKLGLRQTTKAANAIALKDYKSLTNFNKAVIQQTLQESNTRTFSPQGIEIALLKNRPQDIPTLADWMYDEWRSYDVTLTKEKLIEGFKRRLNEDQLPLTIVAVKQGMPIGVVSLKEKEEAEWTNLSAGNPWLGSLQVVSEERENGLGTALLEVAKTLTLRLGYQSLFLYTSNAENLDWYMKRKARLIERRTFRNHEIAILQIPL